MYERFTDRARKTMAFSNQEAQRLNREYIGTEHILLGLVKEGSGVGANVLYNLGVQFPRVRLEVERLVKAGPKMVLMGKLPLTQCSKLAIEKAYEQAKDLGHDYVGTEHLLLGLILSDPKKEGVAAQVLDLLGATHDKVLPEILRTLGENPQLNESGPQPTSSAPTTTPMAGFSITGELVTQMEFRECVDKAKEALTAVKGGKDKSVIEALAWATLAQAIATFNRTPLQQESASDTTQTEKVVAERLTDEQWEQVFGLPWADRDPEDPAHPKDAAGKRISPLNPQRRVLRSLQSAQGQGRGVFGSSIDGITADVKNPYTPEQRMAMVEGINAFFRVAKLSYCILAEDDSPTTPWSGRKFRLVVIAT